MQTVDNKMYLLEVRRMRSEALNKLSLKWANPPASLQHRPLSRLFHRVRHEHHTTHARIRLNYWFLNALPRLNPRDPGKGENAQLLRLTIDAT